MGATHLGDRCWLLIHHRLSILKRNKSVRVQLSLLFLLWLLNVFLVELLKNLDLLLHDGSLMKIIIILGLILWHQILRYIIVSHIVLLFLVLLCLLHQLLLQHGHRWCLRCDSFKAVLLLLDDRLIRFEWDMSLLNLSYLCLFFWLLVLMNLILIFLLDINKLVQKTLSLWQLILIVAAVHLLILVDLVKKPLVLLQLRLGSHLLQILQ